GDQLVGDVRDFVAGKLHAVAGIAAGRAHDFLFLDQGVLDLAEHVLIADALFAHVIAVIFQQIAHFVVEAVLGGHLIIDQGVHNFDDARGLMRVDSRTADPLYDLAREIGNEFSGEKHCLEKMFRRRPTSVYHHELFRLPPHPMKADGCRPFRCYWFRCSATSTVIRSPFYPRPFCGKHTFQSSNTGSLFPAFLMPTCWGIRSGGACWTGWASGAG